MIRIDKLMRVLMVEKYTYDFHEINRYFQIRATFPLEKSLNWGFRRPQPSSWMLRHRGLYVDASAPQAELFVMGRSSIQPDTFSILFFATLKLHEKHLFD